MARIRVLVADDEPLARHGVRQLLVPHPDFTIVGESRNGRETLHALESLTPDLVFLDVQMPEMSGFDVLRAYGAERMPPVVFVTAHDEFAVRAFETNALDYLVKPLTPARFNAALARVRDQLRMREAVTMAARLSALLAAEDAVRSPATHLRAVEPPPLQRMVVSIGTNELVIPVADIDWISARDYYACLHVGGKQHLTREPLGSLEIKLDPRRFVRVHRSAIVQVDRIRELHPTLRGIEVILRDGTRVRVSRRRARALTASLRQRL